MSASWRQRLRHRWRKEQYRPGWLGVFINPFFFARRGLWRGLREFMPKLTGEVLDVGCGSQPYRSELQCRRFVGLDIDSPVSRQRAIADLLYDGTKFPLADCSFDAVLCSQVLEHVFTPEAFLSEIQRVLRPGGVLVLAVPFVWDEHEQPYDFARYSSYGLRALLERNGFEVESQKKTLPDARLLFQLTAAYLYKASRTRNQRLNQLLDVVLIAPVTLAGLAIAPLLPRNPDLYLDNLVLARRR